MKYNYSKSLLLGLTLITSISFAQQIRPLCGHDLMMDQYEKKFPGFKNSVRKTFDESSKSTQLLKSNATPYTVNVVVHVVWNAAVENIDDSIVLSQIQVLNEDYNRLNPDTANLRPVFKPIAGSLGIAFNLSQIIRKKTTSLFDPSTSTTGVPNEMKYDSLGGSTAVDPDHFLNIWVCKLQPLSFFGVEIGQIFGYSFPPNNLSNWPANSGAAVAGDDGVVIDYRCFGRNNPNPISVGGTGSANIVIKGRTPSHEVGHYLGLRHIWGDGGGFGGGGNNCTGDDGIADTPNANDQSQFDCDKTKNTCVDSNLPWTSSDAPDMVENYMDYSAETCMNAFTKGQVAQMDAVLQGPRADLVNGTNGIHKYDLMTRSVSVYPNPATDAVSIFSINHRIHEVELINCLGSTIQKVAVDNNKAVVDVNGLPKGTYIARMLLDNGAVVNKIVIVK